MRTFEASYQRDIGYMYIIYICIYSKLRFETHQEQISSLAIGPGVAGRIPAYEDRGENFAGIHNIGRKETNMWGWVMNFHYR